MSPWTPNANNKRTNSGQEYGYVTRNKSTDPNIIKLYTRVIKKNGVWNVDPNYKRVSFYKTKNGKNFNNVTKLYGGFFPAQTKLLWSTLPRNLARQTKKRGIPYDPGAGDPTIYNF